MSYLRRDLQELVFSYVTLGAGWELLLTGLWLEGTWAVTTLYRLEWLSPGTEDLPCPEKQEG